MPQKFGFYLILCYNWYNDDLLKTAGEYYSQLNGEKGILSPIILFIEMQQENNAMSSTDDKGHDSRAIANRFVGKSYEAGKNLTIMPLVKLVYIAHGWTLGYTGKPLICDTVEAWRHGPVVPQVYHAFRPQGIIIGAPAIDGKGRPYFTEVNEVEEEIISNVYKDYSGFSPFQLSALTHNEGTPWARYEGMPYHTISNENIKAYYEKRVEEVRKR